VKRPSREALGSKPPSLPREKRPVSHTAAAKATLATALSLYKIFVHSNAFLH